MSWEKKDLVHIVNLIRLLNEKATFNQMGVKDNIELNAAFQWVDNLKNKINDSFAPVESPSSDKPEIKVKDEQPIKSESSKKGWFK
jgi:hypothetical protein